MTCYAQGERDDRPTTVPSASQTTQTKAAWIKSSARHLRTSDERNEDDVRTSCGWTGLLLQMHGMSQNNGERNDDSTLFNDWMSSRRSFLETICRFQSKHLRIGPIQGLAACSSASLDGAPKTNPIVHGTLRSPSMSKPMSL